MEINYTDYISQIFTGLSGIGFFIGIIILYKTGILEFLKQWKKNGKNGDSTIRAIEEMKENHLHEISQKLDRIISNTEKEIYILEDIKSKIDK